MNIREINEEYSVSGQITVEEVDEIKALGFKSIVCHRPDGEEFGQPEFAAVAKRAQELGHAYGLDLRTAAEAIVYTTTIVLLGVAGWAILF